MRPREIFLVSALAMFFVSVTAPAQNLTEGEAKAREVINSAIEAMGGKRYRKAGNSHSYGRYFIFGKEGQKGFSKFWDWTVYEPIKSRFQLGEGKRQEVEIYNLEVRKGWKMEGKDSVEELPPERVKDFEKSVKHDLNVVLKTRLNEPGLHLYYYGPDDIEGSEDLEAVDFLDATNDSVVIYFNRNSHLPVRLESQFVDKMGLKHKEETEYHNWHTIQGVHTPLRVDISIDGDLSRQIFLESISYNIPVSSEYFQEPVPEKKK